MKSSGASVEASDASPERSETVQEEFDCWFEEVSAELGVRFSYSNGHEGKQFTILETVGGGIGLLDYDGDGALDVFCPGGGEIDSSTAVPSGSQCGLFRQKASGYQASTDEAGVPDGSNYSHGCVVNDVDCDGFPDVFITCYGQNTLLLNCGDGTFRDAAAILRSDIPLWSTAAAFGDANADGFPDLFVVSYVDWQPDSDEKCYSRGSGQRDVCPPQNYEASPDVFFLNRGDGSFDTHVESAGLRNDGKGMGVIAADLNADRQVEFFVANDVVANHLYSGWNGTVFEETGDLSGLAVSDSGFPEGSMGVDACDVDGDGDQDIVVTNFELEDNAFYHNQGSGLNFIHRSSVAGLAGQGRTDVGFGTGFCDFDSDGWPDLYVLNGHVLYHGGQQPFRQRSALFQNQSGKRFERMSGRAVGEWFDLPHAARGGAVGDLNNDGSPDLVVSCLMEPVAVLRNRISPQNWIRLKPVGTTSARVPVGVRVSISAFGRDCRRSLNSGGGYLSHSDDRLLFALPDDQDEVVVDVAWPSGLNEQFENLRTATDHVIIEGHGKQQGSP